MTVFEKSSKRKIESIKYLVEKGEFSYGYALFKVEELNDNGKLTETDYEELAEYFEELLNKVEEEVEQVEEVNQTIDEPVEEEPIIEETKKENQWK